MCLILVLMNSDHIVVSVPLIHTMFCEVFLRMSLGMSERCGIPGCLSEIAGIGKVKVGRKMKRGDFVCVC